MCYAAPGPRCTNHVQKELDSLVQKVVELEDNGAAEKEVKKVRRAIVHKHAEYDATPGGAKELKEEIAKRESDGSINTALARRHTTSLKRRLAKGEETRAAQKEAYAQAEVRKQRFESIKSQVANRQAEIAAGDPVTIGDMYPRDMTRAMLEQGAMIQENKGAWGGPSIEHVKTGHLKQCGVLATTNLDESHSWDTWDSFSEEEHSGACATVTCNCGDVLDSPLVLEGAKTSDLIFGMNKIR